MRISQEVFKSVFSYLPSDERETCYNLIRNVFYSNSEVAFDSVIQDLRDVRFAEAIAVFIAIRRLFEGRKVILKLAKGKLQTISNGFLSYEFFDAKASSIYDIGTSLTNHFGFKEQSTPVIGLDSIWWDFCNIDVKVTVGWDIWSGCFIMSHWKKGDQFIIQYQNYVENL